MSLTDGADYSQGQPRIAYLQVLRRTTAWQGQWDTLYDVYLFCCQRTLAYSHQSVGRLRSLVKRADEQAAKGLAARVTPCCKNCANRIKADGGQTDLGPVAVPLRRSQGPSEWLLAKRAQSDARTRAAHRYAMGERVHG